MTCQGKLLRISGVQAARSIASMFFSETLLTAGLTARTAKRGAIVAVGAARKTAAVRWNVASDVVLAWIVTLPAAALFGAAFYEAL